jgi:hypothetical protein
LITNIGQDGKPVVLVGSAVPHQFEVSSQRRYFSERQYLVLVVDDDILAHRLCAPGLAQVCHHRGAGHHAYVQSPAARAHCNDEARKTLFATSHLSVEQSVVAHTVAWITHYWPTEPTST